MDNEIKFRAFDKFLDKYIFTGFHILGEVSAFGGVETHIHQTWAKRSEKFGYKTTLEAWNDFEFEQFTGLTDRNNQDIYHRDEITVSLEKWSIAPTCKYIVEKNFGGWGFYDKNQLWRWLYTVVHDCVVSGNSHEQTKEL